MVRPAADEVEADRSEELRFLARGVAEINKDISGLLRPRVGLGVCRRGVVNAIGREGEQARHSPIVTVRDHDITLHQRIGGNWIISCWELWFLLHGSKKVSRAVLLRWKRPLTGSEVHHRFAAFTVIMTEYHRLHTIHCRK